jgi:anaerobic magnesium-protoporphyrin IX monomethyl ester cyclase
MNDQATDPLRENLGTRRIAKLRMADFPNADDIVRRGLLEEPRPESAVDILLVNPPTPDGGLWIRTQHRVGRRTRENMVWPQVSLAQMAALSASDLQGQDRGCQCRADRLAHVYQDSG